MSRYFSAAEIAELLAVVRRPWPIRSTAEERRSLAAESGDALARLMGGFEDMIYGLSSRFLIPGVLMDDLKQAGRDGLLWAIRDFDPGRGVVLATFAYARVRRTILLERAEALQVVRLGPYYTNRVAEWKAAERALGGQARQDEVIARLRWGPEGVRTWRSMLALRPEARVHPVRRERSAGAVGRRFNTCNLADLALAREPDEDAAVPSPELLRPLLGRLTERQRQVIALRFGLGGEEPMILARIGEILGVSKERARQIEAESLAKLKAVAKELYPEKIAAAS